MVFFRFKNLFLLNCNEQPSKCVECKSNIECMKAVFHFYKTTVHGNVVDNNERRVTYLLGIFIYAES